jgi:hypothetical protein
MNVDKQSARRPPRGYAAVNRANTPAYRRGGAAGLTLR